MSAREQATADAVRRAWPQILRRLLLEEAKRGKRCVVLMSEGKAAELLPSLPGAKANELNAFAIRIMPVDELLAEGSSLRAALARDPSMSKLLAPDGGGEHHVLITYTDGALSHVSARCLGRTSNANLN